MTATARAHELAARSLTALPEHRRRTFALRLDRWWDDLIDGLRPVYGTAPDELAERLVTIAARAFAARDGELHELDERRLLEPDWFCGPHMLGYATYPDRFAATCPASPSTSTT